MAKDIQIHIFWGAPTITAHQEEQCPSASNTETWRESHIVYDEQFFQLGADKCKTNSDDKQETLKLMGTCISEHCSVACGSEAGFTDLHKTSVTNQESHPQYRPLYEAHTDVHYGIDIAEKDDKHIENYCADISVLVSSTKTHIQPISLEQNNDPSHHFNILHESLGQYLETCFHDRSKRQKGPKGLECVCLEELSADAEFLSIMTATQVAVQGKGQFKEQGNNQDDDSQAESFTEHTGACSKSFQSSKFFLGTHLVEHELCKETSNSLELFSPVSMETAHNCEMLHSVKTRDCLECAESSSCHLSRPSEELQNEIHIEPWTSDVLCTQLTKSSLDTSKRVRVPEEVADHSSTENQKESKRAKQVHSPTMCGLKKDLKEMLAFQKFIKKSVLLRDCCCKSQKYTVLVTVLHSWHIKEIQIKSGPQAGTKVPLATIIVFDQSEVERKVVLWRTAAYWSLTVFPGDIICLSDVTVYEDSWYGEIMLQSSFGSQLFNLGCCSSLHRKKLDITAIRDLLAYVSSKHSYLLDLPERQPQSLEHVQHVHLSQLQPDILVHSVLKIMNIIVLTESIYLYNGQKQRKIVLTVEQVKGQHYTLVLWGTATAWGNQIQRRKDHLWEFRNIYSQRNSLSGEIELHTTPWSSCECIFDDDKRAIDFKAQYQKHKVSPMEEVIGIAALLEKKFSGEIQVHAHLAELQFIMPAPQNRQLVLDSNTPLELILSSLPAITYSGCGVCGSELKTDENKIYLQCFSCLPVNQVKTYYRPALLTAVDGEQVIQIHVPSEIIQKIFLNIPPDWLNRTIVSSSEVTYAMIVADLCHSLLTNTKDIYRLKIQSLFVLDENSIPIHQDFHLLDFYQDLL
ncbi:LOW QUALITY PROTEIN: shieldin complex subunit 2 [Microcaecilia unicolor]|uniref:LOW QUALITY PROTEIN: shieldin complex subunit 2 n=1 Tax=Microcaecilia unicolor TaxID=1415580 RepID=A0A6P7Y8N0_9AMPH|nr:LOW QUALITY PROTEIN: shieldin complex subunit 2 [Microcaecilia unicolor]